MSQNNKIIRDYLDGMSQNQLEEKYHLHNTSIVKILKDNNVSIRSISDANKKYDVEKEELAQAFDSDLSSSEIAEKFNMKLSTVYAYRHQHNMEEFL